MKRIVLSLAIIAAFAHPILLAKEPLKVLSTIKPIHTLVSAIVGEHGESTLIIPSNASPHHYSLKPSDLRQLYKADLVFRLDEKLESFLQKSLRNVDDDKLITLSKTPQLKLLDVKGQHHHNEDDDEKHDDEEEGEIDYHLWLNPENAIALAQHISLLLSETAPKFKDDFVSNTQKLIDEIEQGNLAVKQQLAEVDSVPFLVTHDAWQYFTEYYQLNQVGSVSAQEHLKPSAKAIADARKKLVNSKAQCLVTEPSFRKNTLAVLAEDLSINVTKINPLGDDNTTYTGLLQYTASNLLKCLRK